MSFLTKISMRVKVKKEKIRIDESVDAWLGAAAA